MTVSELPITAEARHDFADLASRPVLKRKRPGQLIAMVVVGLFAVMGAYVIVTNPGFGWPIVAKYLLDIRILNGLLTTIELTVIAMVLGLVIGLVIAVMRMSDNALLRGVAGAYIWFFRGTPLMVQMLFWGFAAVLFPTIGIGIPGGPMLVEWNTNDVLPLFVAGILGLGLNEGAYMAEIVRAGLMGVPAGQSEASHAMGFSRMETLRHVVIPQAMKIILPPVGNETISMLKTTSLVIVIGVGDLLYNAQQIYARNLQQIPLLIVASLWYILLTTILSLVQARIEKRYSRGNTIQARKA
ncbi:amino acid ABC transporter permease [Arthrobacter sp. B2a2-09]|uniref:amino acid ABC transporter permease n=1 Tax=Arthrobacter sp. B2a2-09 TaxID=2952822 RepID=UPI0022CD853A|nr:amino acid ABC transporter permease [Arthrobacter sp. B2a2-09]